MTKKLHAQVTINEILTFDFHFTEDETTESSPYAGSLSHEGAAPDNFEIAGDWGRASLNIR